MLFVLGMASLKDGVIILHVRTLSELEGIVKNFTVEANSGVIGMQLCGPSLDSRGQGPRRFFLRRKIS